MFSIILKRKNVPKLSEQRHTVKDAAVPMPLYTCLHVKKNEVAQNFCGKKRISLLLRRTCCLRLFTLLSSYNYAHTKDGHLIAG